MANSIRNLTDYHEYPGFINNDTNQYEFPILYKRNANGKVRSWQAFARLIKPNSKVGHSSVDWNILDEDSIPISKEYLDYSYELDIDFAIAQYWTEDGQLGGKITRRAPTYAKPVNVGRANYRNSLQKALTDLNCKYESKIDSGFDLENPDIIENVSTNLMYFPMLAKKYKEDFAHIKFPAHMQPKLDGNRINAYLATDNVSNATADDVILYTRQKKTIPGKEYLKTELLPMLVNGWNNELNESMYIDCEYYTHGTHLNTLSSSFRSESEDGVDIYIFDIYYPSNLQMPFKDRWNHLVELFNALPIKQTKITIPYDFNKAYNTCMDTIDKYASIYENTDEEVRFFKKNQYNNFTEWYNVCEKIAETKFEKSMKVIRKNHIVLTPTIIVNSRTQLEGYYYAWLELKFEGAMLRNSDGAYTAGLKDSSKLRSKDLQKLKPLYTEEYTIVDYTTGKSGSNAGIVIWICDAGNGKTFKATPKNISIEDSRKLYSEFINSKKFINEYKGMKIMVEHEGLSKYNVPLYSKALGLRPYK